MKINPGMVRAVAAVFAMLVVAIFVHACGALQSNWLQHGNKLSLAVLPLPTMFYHRFALAGYVLPIATALLLTIKSPERAEHAAWREVLLRVVGVFALVWLLGAFLAWQLPYYYPVASVE